MLLSNGHASACSMPSAAPKKNDTIEYGQLTVAEKLCSWLELTQMLGSIGQLSSAVSGTKGAALYVYRACSMHQSSAPSDSKNPGY